MQKQKVASKMQLSRSSDTPNVSDEMLLKIAREASAQGKPLPIPAGRGMQGSLNPYLQGAMDDPANMANAPIKGAENLMRKIMIEEMNRSLNQPRMVPVRR